MPVPITTAASTTSPPSPATTATAAGRTFLARTRLIDRQRAPLKIFLVKHGNRLIRVLLRAHLDERKTARPASRPVLHDVDCHDGACLCEVVLQIVLGHCEGS